MLVIPNNNSVLFLCSFKSEMPLSLDQFVKIECLVLLHYDRCSYWVRMAKMGSIYKSWLLLRYWAANWHTSGLVV